MAEVIGIVASGISIAQVTGQVAHSVIKLKSYWEQVKDAPEEVSSLMRDLEFINLLLSDFEREHIQSRLPDIVFDNDIFHQSLIICKEGARELSELVDLLSYRSSTTTRFRKQRGAINFVLKGDQIKRYKSRLKQALNLLSLSHQSYTRALVRTQLQSMASILPRSPVIGADIPGISQPQSVEPAVELMIREDQSASAALSLESSAAYLCMIILSLSFIAMFSPSSDSSLQLRLSMILINASIFATSLRQASSHVSKKSFESMFSAPLALLKWVAIANFETFTLGSVELSAQPCRKRKKFNRLPTRNAESQIVARYRSPIWLSYSTWQFCCYRAERGWTCHLVMYNVIPSISRQFRYSRSGSLLKLQHVIANKEASILDQTEDGNTMLSIAAQNGHIDMCRWLLQNGAHTDHMRFGSILNQVLYYGGWMSFQEGVSTFEIVRLLQRSEDIDIFDCSDDNTGRCAFYGRKEVFAWLISQSHSVVGYAHTVEEHVQLALNVSRNIQHNAPELVRTVLANIDLGAALRVQNAEGVTLLHRVASRLGGGFAYEVQGMEKSTKFLDDGFASPRYPSDKELLSRNGWSSFLRDLNLGEIDTHTISQFELTPMMTGFRTLVHVWIGSPSAQIEALSRFLHIWLSDLQGLSLDLLRYGEEEKRLQGLGLVCKDFHPRRKRDSKGDLVQKRGSNKLAVSDAAFGTLRLISFEPHASPLGWRLWWSEPTDEFAGDFWRMCELCETMTTPGAWDDGIDIS